MHSSSNTLTLKQHWLAGAPPPLDLFEGEETLTTEQTQQDLASEAGAVLETGGLGLPWVPSLVEIKRHLRLEPDDSEHNELLVGHREAAAALLLSETGQDARVGDYTGKAEYEAIPYNLIKIDRSNVQSVQAVKETDAEGIEITIDEAEYTLQYKNKVAYIEGKFNENCDQHSVAVEYKRGAILDSYDAAMLKQVMLDTINSLYNEPGRLTEKNLKRSPAFNAVVNILRDRRSIGKWNS